MRPEHTSGSVLIVDDDATHRAGLRRYLGTKGLAITECANGEEALELARLEAFDVVLLDVLMPGPGGLEVLQALRRLRPLTELPVIMATARDETSDVVEALRLGANDYVTKPFDFPVVLARVQGQLTLKRSVERIRRLEQSLAQRNADLEAANVELAEANRRMRLDLEAAARAQQALLPAPAPVVAGARFAWRFRPCAHLAGDLLNVAVLDERHVALYVLDVSGHGAQAALLAVMVSRALTQLLTPRPPLPPAEVVARLHADFPWDDRTQQFFTLLYGVLGLDTGDFRYVTAGHPGPLHLACGAAPRVLKLPSPPVALGDGLYPEHRLTLAEGDRLYLYSDGLFEARNEARDVEPRAFGVERLCRAVERDRAAPLAEGLAALLREVEAWCAPHEPQDDISVLAVERA
jgi:sigma-B regulation protein RsbU (phosphoserine phosphatase)